MTLRLLELWAVPSFRALSGRLKFTVRRHKFNKDSLSGQLDGIQVSTLGIQKAAPARERSPEGDAPRHVSPKGDGDHRETKRRPEGDQSETRRGPEGDARLARDWMGQEEPPLFAPGTARDAPPFLEKGAHDHPEVPPSHPPTEHDFQDFGAFEKI